MKTLQDLLPRLRAERGWSQSDLAHKAGVSPATIAAIEQGVKRRWYPRTARSIYEALADAAPLDEADAAAYLAATGVRPPPPRTPPGRLDTAEYLAELAAGRVKPAGTGPMDRPDRPDRTLYWLGYRPGASVGEGAEVTVNIQCAVADLIVTVGPARAEAAIRSLMSIAASAPPPSGRGQGEGASKSPADLKPPPGSVARRTAEGSVEFIPVEKPPKTGDPAKPKARRIDRG